MNTAKTWRELKELVNSLEEGFLDLPISYLGEEKSGDAKVEISQEDLFSDGEFIEPESQQPKEYLMEYELVHTKGTPLIWLD